MKHFNNETTEVEPYANWQEAFSEAKDIYDYSQNHPEDEMSRMHSGGPAYVAALCVRDHIGELNEEQKQWCAELIIKAVSEEMNSFDITVSRTRFPMASSRPAAMVLPLLLGLFTKRDESVIRYSIVASLLHPSQEVRGFAIRGAHLYLWKSHPEFARACLVGMVEYSALTKRLSPHYHSLYLKNPKKHAKQIIKEIHKLRKRISSLQLTQTLDVQNINFETHDAGDLLYALAMIPTEAHDECYSNLFRNVLNALIKKFQDREEFGRSREGDFDHMIYEFRSEFGDLFARFVLCQPINEALKLCRPLAEAMDNCPELISDMLPWFVYAEDAIASGETFWSIWDIMAQKAFGYQQTVHEGTSRYRYIHKIIRTLLLVEIPWKDEATEWKPLTKHPEFIKTACREVGQYPAGFGAIVQLFSSIGQVFLPEGFLWLNEGFKLGNPQQIMKDTNTRYYLEILMRQAIHQFGYDIRNNAFLKEAVMVLLDALVNEGSYVAFQIRERMIAPLPSM